MAGVFLMVVGIVGFSRSLPYPFLPEASTGNRLLAGANVAIALLQMYAGWRVLRLSDGGRILGILVTLAVLVLTVFAYQTLGGGVALSRLAIHGFILYALVAHAPAFWR